MNWTWFLFSFEGRINRAKFWFAAFMWFATIYSFMTLFTWIMMGILFVELFCLRGTRGPNRFGPDPLAPVVPVTPPDTRPSWDQLNEVEFVPHSAGPSPGEHVKRGHD